MDPTGRGVRLGDDVAAPAADPGDRDPAGAGRTGRLRQAGGGDAARLSLTGSPGECGPAALSAAGAEDGQNAQSRDPVSSRLGDRGHHAGPDGLDRRDDAGALPGALASGVGDKTLEEPAGCGPVAGQSRGNPRLALVTWQVRVCPVTGTPLPAVSGRPVGLSRPVTASNVVAALVPDDRRDDHRDQWCYAVASVAVAGLYRGDERAAAAAATADPTARCTTARTTGGRGS